MGKTSYKYKIRIKKWNPVKGYIFCMTPTIMETIKKELNKLELAGFIKPSKLPYDLHTVCVLKKN